MCHIYQFNDAPEGLVALLGGEGSGRGGAEGRKGEGKLDHGGDGGSLQQPKSTVVLAPSAPCSSRRQMAQQKISQTWLHHVIALGVRGPYRLINVPSVGRVSQKSSQNLFARSTPGIFLVQRSTSPRACLAPLSIGGCRPLIFALVLEFFLLGALDTQVKYASGPKEGT